jgi:hypothetical protein
MGLFDFLKPKKKDIFSGGLGESFETAVVLNTRSGNAGVAAEGEFIAAQCGTRNKDWKKKEQALVSDHGKHFDVVTVELSDGKTRVFHFDISQFYGRI